MKKLIILGSFLGLLTACHAQEHRQKNTANVEHSDRSSQKPKENWQVNKKYDKNGNLVQLDSTYTYNWSSSNIDNPETRAKADSLIQNFQNQMLHHFNAMGQGDFFDHPSNQIPGDTTASVPFFSQDREMSPQNFGPQMNAMQAQMRQIDSLQQAMLERFFGQPETGEPQDKGSSKKTLSSG